LGEPDVEQRKGRKLIRRIVWAIVVASPIIVACWLYGGDVLVRYHFWRMTIAESDGERDAHCSRLSAFVEAAPPYVLEKLRNGSDKEKRAALEFYDLIRARVSEGRDVGSGAVVKAAAPLMYRPSLDAITYYAIGVVRQYGGEDELRELVRSAVGMERCESGRATAVSMALRRLRRRRERDVLLELLRAKDPAVRKLALLELEWLFRYGRELDDVRRKAVARVRELVNSSGEDERREAIIALAQAGDEAGFRMLAQVLRDDMRAGEPRWTGFYYAPHPRFAPLLVPLLDEVPDKRWARTLCEALAIMMEVPPHHFDADPAKAKAWWKARQAAGQRD